MSLLVIVGIGLSLLPLSSRTLANSPATELRGVWLTNIDSDVLYGRANPGYEDWQQTRLSFALKRLADLRFNTLYPTVWNGGYTLYPSPVAKATLGFDQEPNPRLAGRDVLSEIVTQSHDLGLSVLPWFEFGLMAPAQSELAAQHPDWITQRQDGTQIVKEGQDDRVWLNPFHPEVQTFLVDLIVDVAARYDIDGIQLDDHFGLPVALGYDPWTVNLYQQMHQGKSPPPNPHDPDWMRWRADQLTALMKRLFWAVKAVNPNCLISLSPNPYDFSYTHFLQDWHTWERQGFVEELIVQVYRRTLRAYRRELADPVVKMAQEHIPVSIGILSGLKNRPMPPDLVRQQIQVARDRNFAGVSFFFYETLAPHEPALKTLFQQPAQRPQLNP
ncbi:family 10 glycosylhydrolase [Synechococcales cyanobacterium C]|uniref:Family 10 glycosylhydrolase n=2 Tax=Petrachloros TaxID=2918834 RepID=A0A8K2A6W7_9CYAN|nr:family 10 glycosylhydrolase [Petrachloros mirabilis]NCJ05465.1 family 10 glycosylhydrolase [Petrachloros mirabilis ULC683]